jgi:hypothetical protein
MKIHLLRTLPLLLLLGLLVSHVGAIQSPEALTPTSAEACAAAETLGTLEFPVQPFFVADLANSGTCSPCTSHFDCSVPCGGFGACIADFGLECGSDREQVYCFCN